MKYPIFAVLLVGVIQMTSAFYFPSILPELTKVKPLFTKSSSLKLQQPKALQLKYHIQQLNHLNESDERVFIQRYIEDPEFHKPNGPIILFVGGQEGLVQEFIQFGPVREIAEINNGYLIYPEHRYMGYSWPFANLTLENLQFLKADQVLGDLAHLIKTLKKNETFENSKVILVGPSLAGTIVSWFRSKYPELSVGAWASSGPLEVKADVPELKVELGNIFARFGGRACYNKIRDGFKEIEKDLENGDMTRINKYLRVCEGYDPTYEKDALLLVNTLGALFSTLVSSTNENYVEFMCESMLEVDDNIEAISEALEAYINAVECLNMNYNYTVQVLQNVNDESNARSFLYLACYEYGWWTSSEAKDQPFGTIVTLDYYVNLCRDVFLDDSITKDSLHANAKRLNDKYGGLSANFTNLYTTQGLIDPNRLLGLNSNAGSSAITEVIYGGTHANDIYWFLHDETGPIKKARMQAKLLISKWLQE